MSRTTDVRMEEHAGGNCFDCAIVGGGPAGLAAAVALAVSGCRSVLIDRVPPPDAPKDTRTTALFGASIELLRNLGVWNACLVGGAPIRTIRIADATGRIFRAPTVNFQASEAGLDAFGLNVPNADLVQALRERAEAESRLEMIFGGGVSDIACGADSVRLKLAETQTISARLVIGADGRESVCRRAAGIRVSETSYAQSAIVCDVSHTAPHNDTSTELHRTSGPLTLVPMPDAHRSALVWVTSSAEADRLTKLDDRGFAAELEHHIASFAGPVRETSPRKAFPLARMSVHPIAARRTALIGEAAHVLAPIGAQGLNLGFRDVAGLADIVGAAISIGEDPGGDRVLAAYVRARRFDVVSRDIAVDALNRSLLIDFLPGQALRSVAAHMLGAAPPLRRLAIWAGLGSPVPT